MKLSLDDVVRIVNEHVAKNRRRKTPISADTGLFEEGLVDSFGLVDIATALEKASGEALTDGALMPDDFATPRALYARLQELG